MDNNYNLNETFINNQYEHYLDSVLKINKGKMLSIHMTFPLSNEWQDKIFTGILEHTEKDYIILSEPKTGKWYILPIIYLCYIESDETIDFKNK